MREEELYSEAKELRAPHELVKWVAENGRLPVVTFTAGGIATPADAALCMQLGADGVFVGSGIFKSSDPSTRAKAIVEATTHFRDAEILARVSRRPGRSDERALRRRSRARRAARDSRLVTRAVRRALRLSSVDVVRAGWASASFLAYTGALTILLAAVWLESTCPTAMRRPRSSAGRRSCSRRRCLRVRRAAPRRPLLAGLFAFVSVALFAVFVAALEDWFGGSRTTLRCTAST